MKDILYSLFKLINQPGKDHLRLKARNALVHMELLLIPIDLHAEYWNNPNGISFDDIGSDWKFELINNLNGYACVIEQTLDDPEKSIFVYM